MPTPKRDTRLLVVAAICLFLILTSTYIGRLAHKAQLEAEIARWESKNELSEAQQWALAAELRYVRSNAYVEALAHGEFNMIKDGEELIAVVPIKQDNEVAVTTINNVTGIESPWQQLLQQLGFR